MPIHLITGLPGSGKSLSAVELLYKLSKKDSGGRPVYAVGIDGLVDGLAEPLDNPRAWEALPDGSLVVVDEAQKFFPAHRGDTPAYIRALSEHRHRGFDFVLVTQHPGMIDSYVRRLVGEHTHLVRRWGSKVATRYRWGEVVDDVQSSTARSRGVVSYWRYPKDLYRLYKSASLHTVKARIPWQMYLLALLVLVVPLCGWYAWGLIHAPSSSSDHGIVAGKKDDGRIGVKTDRRPNQVQGKTVKEEKDKRIHYKDALEYTQYHSPRIPGFPWSAPVFDDRKPTVDPEIYCIVSEVKGCRCYTEQITRYSIDDAQCRVIAEQGVYNPYKRRPDARQVAKSSVDARSEDRRQQVGLRASERSEAASAVPVDSGSPGYASPAAPAVAGSAWVLGPPRSDQ